MLYSHNIASRFEKDCSLRLRHVRRVMKPFYIHAARLLSTLEYVERGNNRKRRAVITEIYKRELARD